MKQTWNKEKAEIRANDSWQANLAHAEMVIGFDKLINIGPCVSVFGSARLKPEDPYFKMAEEISESLSKMGYGVISGGGPGIMEAANKGAKQGGSASIGVGIELPFETGNNKHIDYDKNLHMNYFHVRKVMFLKYSQAFVIMPGGFGTLDELFEVLVLCQTGKSPKFPTFLVGKEFWGGLVDWMKNSMLEKGVISEDDFDLFRLVDSTEELLGSFDKFMKKYRKENRPNF